MEPSVVKSQAVHAPTAIVITDPVRRVQIPDGAQPGDMFLVSNDGNGRPFTVIVPQGASPGSFIDVLIPSNETGKEDDNDEIPRGFCGADRAVTGAAIAGGIIGGLTLGIVGGIVLAGGAAFIATNKKDTKIGKEVRKVGGSVYSGTIKAKTWVEKQFERA